LKIYGTDGKMVYQSQPLSNQVVLTLQDLSAGVYMLDLEINGEHRIERLILE